MVLHSMMVMGYTQAILGISTLVCMSYFCLNLLIEYIILLKHDHFYLGSLRTRVVGRASSKRIYGSSHVCSLAGYRVEKNTKIVLDLV